MGGASSLWRGNRLINLRGGEKDYPIAANAPETPEQTVHNPRSPLVADKEPTAKAYMKRALGSVS